MTDGRPILKLAAGQGKRLRAGSPWVFSNEIAMKPEYRKMDKGGLIRLEAEDGSRFGTFMFNPHSLIAARLLDRDPSAEIGAAWVFRRLEAAVSLRARICDTPYHRLVHAEGDLLPGLIVDRYDDVAVVQANTAGMDRLMPFIVDALKALLPLRAVVARNDSPSRGFEGLADDVRLMLGDDGSAVVEEGGVRFPVDPMGGQKTGWFFDQRYNRDRVSALASGARVLDVCCHVGAFGLRCAAAGASSVTLVDSSASALGLARDAALANGLAGVVALRRDDAFDALGALAGTEQRFDIVICDPPAFAKSRKDADAGLRAYGRMARLAAGLVAPGGFLFTASCSHHASVESWSGQIAYGLFRARREARILWTGGAGMDHPVHPHLPETAYLKGMLVQVW